MDAWILAAQPSLGRMHYGSKSEHGSLKEDEKRLPKKPPIPQEYVGFHKSFYDSKYSTMTVNVYWMEDWKEP